MLCQTNLDSIDQTTFLGNVVPTLLAQHCIGYLPHKSCILFMDQHSTGNFVIQCWPRQIQTKLEIIFRCKVVCGLWAGITHVRFLCNVATGRSDNIVWVIFLRKRVCALWANIAHIIFLCNVSQMYLDNNDQTIFLCNAASAWSIQHCIGYFLIKVVCQSWANITQVISLCNVDPDFFFLCKVACGVSMGQHCAGNFLVQCWL